MVAGRGREGERSGFRADMRKRRLERFILNSFHAGLRLHTEPTVLLSAGLHRFWPVGGKWRKALDAHARGTAPVLQMQMSSS